MTDEQIDELVGDFIPVYEAAIRANVPATEGLERLRMVTRDWLAKHTQETP